MKNDQILFTIITPVYNCVDSINRTIQSIISQKFSGVQYIILDGCSNDGTTEQILKYKDRIDIIVEKDKGIYDAMNKGIQKAKGEYLYFIGSGDVLEDNILSEVYKYAKTGDYDVIYGGVEVGANRGKYCFEYNQKIMFSKNICHQAMFFKKNIFKKFGRYKLRYKYLSDYEMNLRIFGDQSTKKLFINKIIANYEGNGASDNFIDEAFKKDKDKIIRESYGMGGFVKYKFNYYSEKVKNKIIK